MTSRLVPSRIQRVAAADGEPRRDVDASWLVGAGVAVVALSIFLLANLDLLGAQVVADADAAANQLLIDQATRAELLVGHYSRTGFHHPGPFFLYVQAAGELLLHRWTGLMGSPFPAHATAVMALNAALLGWCAAIAARATGSRATGVAFAALAIGVHVWQPGLMTSSWMPAVVVVPFLLLLLSGSTVAGGSWRDLPAFAVALGANVHGHLTTALFALAIGTLVFAVAMWRRRRGEITDRPTGRQVATAAAILTVFATPLLLHVITDFPGELDEYLAYARTSRATDGATAAVHFTAEILLRSPLQAVAVLAAAVGALVGARRLPHLRVLLHSGLLLSAVAAVGLAGYALRGVDDTELTYLGWFGYAVPVFVLWLGLAATIALIAQVAPRVSELAAVGISAFVLVIVGTTTSLAEPYRGVPEIGAMAAGVGSAPIRLRFEQDSWPTGVGLLAELQRREVAACVDDPRWEFMVTAANICDAADRTGQPITTRVVGPREAAEPPGEVIYRSGGFLLWEESAP